MLSRRSFLQLVGASLAATALRPPTTSLLAAVEQEAYQGRALKALPVYATRNSNVQPVAHLWPDSITPILDSNNEWYQVPGGWVQRDGLQPMLAYNAHDYQFMNTIPFWAEVAAPVASVRAYCAADAPLVTRIGHGGVSQIIDALPGEPNGWYGIANQQGDLLGWTQGVFWRPVQAEANSGDNHTLRLDRADGVMAAYEGEKLILKASFSAGSRLQAGEYVTKQGAIGGLQWQSERHYEGLSWVTNMGNNQMIAGVYWHNRFGRAVSDGPAVQVTPLLARWLYGWLGDNAHILVE